MVLASGSTLEMVSVKETAEASEPETALELVLGMAPASERTLAQELAHSLGWGWAAKLAMQMEVGSEQRLESEWASALVPV